jgi:hypothetical protein
MLWFERRLLSILENMWYSPLWFEFEDRACRRFAWQGSLRYQQPNPMTQKGTAWKEKRPSRACVRFESTIWPSVGPIPRSPKNDDQDRDQDHQQVVKIEFKRRPEPLKENGLINQSHSLFIGKILNPEARYEHYEIGNRVQ